MPDEMTLKLVYSDFRTVTSASSQGEYVYRGNSLFDCDFTGVGGQPDGFDQWKLLYGVYRVVAADVEVQACGGNGFGLLAVAPATTSASFISAEETSGLRKAKSCVFSTTEVAKVRARYHTGAVLGKEDVAVLSDPNDAAAVTANPTEQYFIHVSTETSGASDIVYVWTKITYYCRLEAPLSTLDTVARHRHQFLMASGCVSSGQPPPPLCKPRTVVDSSSAPRAAAVCDAGIESGNVHNPLENCATSFQRQKRLEQLCSYSHDEAMAALASSTAAGPKECLVCFALAGSVAPGIVHADLKVPFDEKEWPAFVDYVKRVVLGSDTEGGVVTPGLAVPCQTWPTITTHSPKDHSTCLRRCAADVLMEDPIFAGPRFAALRREAAPWLCLLVNPATWAGGPTQH